MLICVRHPPVEAEGLCYGQLDLPMTRSPDHWGPTVVWPRGRLWSSPARRCRALAAWVAEAQGSQLSVDPRLWEMGFGAWEGRKWADLDRTEVEAWSSDWERNRPPRGESALDLQRRVAEWCADLDRSRTHVLVAHAGVVRALRVVRGGCSWPDAMARPVPHLRMESFGL
ncbi:MAG: histidine phosphatase family protein [Myxococcota bacterium]